MKAWIVRFASLYVFNLVVLLVIGWLTPARVGFAALWASVLLTAATLWLKPLISKGFASATAKSASSRTPVGQKLVQYGAVLVVELIIWILVVVFSGISIRGFFWGWVIPPIVLLIAWAIYDAIDDRIEARAGELYDSATGHRGAASTGQNTATIDPPAKVDLDDGLTPEQRKMLDDLS